MVTVYTNLGQQEDIDEPLDIVRWWDVWSADFVDYVGGK
jgi:hypothetical protein